MPTLVRRWIKLSSTVRSRRPSTTARSAELRDRCRVATGPRRSWRRCCRRSSPGRRSSSSWSLACAWYSPSPETYLCWCRSSWTGPSGSRATTSSHRWPPRTCWSVRRARGLTNPKPRRQIVRALLDTLTGLGTGVKLPWEIITPRMAIVLQSFVLRSKPEIRQT